MSARRFPFKPLSWRNWLVVIFGLVLGVGLLVCWQVYASYLSFRDHAGITGNELLTLWRDSSGVTLDQTDGWITLLLLGTDELEYRDNTCPLSDTIIIASLHLTTNQVNLLSLPRDLAPAALGHRLNAIYPLACQQDASAAARVTADRLGNLLDLPIHYVIVANFGHVKDFIDLIGGVDIDIVNSFVDYQYPRDDVDIRVVHDPALLYETIEFTAGPAHLDGTTALKFMRSRHSQSQEGSDFARSRRQQQVLASIGSTLTHRLIEQLAAYDFSLLGELYQFYDRHFATQLPFTTALALLRHFVTAGQLPTISNHQLSVGPHLNLHENPQDYTIQVTNLATLRQDVHQYLYALPD